MKIKIPTHFSIQTFLFIGLIVGILSYIIIVQPIKYQAEQIIDSAKKIREECFKQDVPYYMNNNLSQIFYEINTTHLFYNENMTK